MAAGETGAAETVSPQDLEQRLAQAERNLVAHDFLLRALLTHLAVVDPQAYGALIGGFTHSRLYRSPGTAGELTREVADQLVGMLQDIAGSLPGRR